MFKKKSMNQKGAVKFLLFLLLAGVAIVSLVGFFFGQNPNLPQSGTNVFVNNSLIGGVYLLLTIIFFVIAVIAVLALLSRWLLGKSGTYRSMTDKGFEKIFKKNKTLFERKLK